MTKINIDQESLVLCEHYQGKYALIAELPELIPFYESYSGQFCFYRHELIMQCDEIFESSEQLNKNLENQITEFIDKL